MRACPRGVKVTSGLCLWPDSLGRAAATSRSSVGEELGQGSGWAQHFQDVGSPASAEHGFCKRGNAVFFFLIKHSLNRLYFSHDYKFRNGLTFAIAEN